MTCQECLHTWFEDFPKVIKPMFNYHDGAIWPSDMPGLGIELDHDGVSDYAIDPRSSEANRLGR